jgi:hypothetical protein
MMDRATRPLILPSPFAKASVDGPLLLPQGEKGLVGDLPPSPHSKTPPDLGSDGA